MTVVIDKDSHCALTAPSITRMTSLTQIALGNFVSNLFFAFLLNRNRQDDINLFHCESTRFGV